MIKSIEVVQTVEGGGTGGDVNPPAEDTTAVEAAQTAMEAKIEEVIGAISGATATKDETNNTVDISIKESDMSLGETHLSAVTTDAEAQAALEPVVRGWFAGTANVGDAADNVQVTKVTISNFVAPQAAPAQVSLFAVGDPGFDYEVDLKKGEATATVGGHVTLLAETGSEVDPPAPVGGTHVLEAKNLPPRQYKKGASGSTAESDAVTGAQYQTGETAETAYFTALFGDNTRNDTTDKTWPEPHAYTTTHRFNTGGAMKADQDAIQFTTSDAATVEVWWVQTGGDEVKNSTYTENDAVRNINITTAANLKNVVAKTELKHTAEADTTLSAVPDTRVKKNSVQYNKLTVPSADTYLLGGDGAIYICKVEVTEGATSEEPSADEQAVDTVIEAFKGEVSSTATDPTAINFDVAADTAKGITDDAGAKTHVTNLINGKLGDSGVTIKADSVVISNFAAASASTPAQVSLFAVGDGGFDYTATLVKGSVEKDIGGHVTLLAETGSDTPAATIGTGDYNFQVSKALASMTDAEKAPFSNPALTLGSFKYDENANHNGHGLYGSGSITIATSAEKYTTLTLTTCGFGAGTPSVTGDYALATAETAESGKYGKVLTIYNAQGDVTVSLGNNVYVHSLGVAIKDQADELFTIDVDSNITGGAVTFEPVGPSTGTKLAKDTPVKVTVTPEDGNKLTAGSLKYNGTEITETSGAYSFTMPNANTTITAAFEADATPHTYELTVSEEPITLKMGVAEFEPISFTATDNGTANKDAVTVAVSDENKVGARVAVDESNNDAIVIWAKAATEAGTPVNVTVTNGTGDTAVTKTIPVTVLATDAEGYTVPTEWSFAGLPLLYSVDKYAGGSAAPAKFRGLVIDGKGSCQFKNNSLALFQVGSVVQIPVSGPSTITVKGTATSLTMADSDHATEPVDLMQITSQGGDGGVFNYTGAAGYAKLTSAVSGGTITSIKVEAKPLDPNVTGVVTRAYVGKETGGADQANDLAPGYTVTPGTPNTTTRSTDVGITATKLIYHPQNTEAATKGFWIGFGMENTDGKQYVWKHGLPGGTMSPVPSVATRGTVSVDGKQVNTIYIEEDKSTDLDSEGKFVVQQCDATSGEVLWTYNVTVAPMPSLEYPITVADATNGTVEVKVDNTKVTSAAKDAEVTIEVTPENGYELDTLTYTAAGGQAQDIKETKTFTMPAASVTVTATFKATQTPTPSGTYKMGFGVLPTDTLSLADANEGEIATGVVGVKLYAGGKNSKTNVYQVYTNDHPDKAIPYGDYVGYLQGGDNPDKAGATTVPTAGTYYRFVVEKDGKLTIDYALASAKAGYVVKKDSSDTVTNEQTPEATKGHKQVIIPDAKTGDNYYIVVNGSKAGLYGFTFETALTDGEKPNYNLAAGKTAAAAANYDATLAEAGNQAAAEALAQKKAVTAVNNHNLTVTIVDDTFTMPETGDGTYKFKVKLTTANGETETTDELTMHIEVGTPVQTITVTVNGGGEAKVMEGKTLKLDAAVTPDNATNKEVEWASDNTAVATVDQTGLVTGVKIGTAKITATAKDGSETVGELTIAVEDDPDVDIYKLNKTDFPAVTEDTEINQTNFETVYGADTYFGTTVTDGLQKRKDSAGNLEIIKGKGNIVFTVSANHTADVVLVVGSNGGTGTSTFKLAYAGTATNLPTGTVNGPASTSVAEVSDRGTVALGTDLDIFKSTPNTTISFADLPAGTYTLTAGSAHSNMRVHTITVTEKTAVTDTPATVTFELSFDVTPDPVPTAPAQVTVTKGQAIGAKLPAGTAFTGYEFKGWFVKDTTTAVTAETVVDDDMVVVGKYEKTGGSTDKPDTTAIDTAIAKANEAMKGVEKIDGKTAEEVEEGKKFVTTEEMGALTQAIANAEAAKETAADDAAVTAAVNALKSAVTTFEGAIKTGTMKPDHEHTWDAGEVTTEATCTEKGEKTFHCTVKDCTATKTEEIAALGHSWGEWAVTKPATCTAEGEETRGCARCDVTETRAIDKLAHTAGDWTEKPAATCTEAGEKVKKCTACGTEMETQTIEALGHDFKDGVCTRCSMKESAPADHTHTWSAWTTSKAATCTEAGEETRSCTDTENCGATEKRAIAATGHSWSEWAVTKEADCTNAGQMTRTCSVCEETETKTIDSLGHDYVDGVCSRCGAKKPSSGGHSGGSGSSVSASNTKTETLTDGTKRVTETKRDGTTVVTDTKPDGTKVVTTTDPEGAVTTTVTLGRGTDKTNVSVPVADANAGMVPVIVKADGTEEIIRNSAVEDGNVVFPLEESANIKIVNNAKHFVDIDKHWAEDEVNFVSARDLFNGVDATHFAPDASMTRGMMATVLFRLDGESKSDKAVDFSDVKAGDWFADAVDWAAEAGVINGYTDGSFAPNKSITREELVVMVYRYAGAPEVKATEAMDGFNDVDQVADWAETAMNWAVQNGIINGKGNGTLDPKGNATRAEVSAVLERFVKLANQ